MSVSDFVCPITGCKNKPDQDNVIEFTIPEVEGVLKATICDYHHRMVSAGFVGGVSLSLEYLPAKEASNGNVV